MLNAAIRLAESRKIGSRQDVSAKTSALAAPAVVAGSADACPVGGSTPTPPRSRILQDALDAQPDLSLKPWRDLWLHERFIVSVAAAGREPHAYALSVNLRRDREDALLAHPDPADHLRRYLARELRSAFGQLLPFAFAFEASFGGARRWHFHGVAVAPDGSIETRDKIKSALERAAGKFKGKGSATQARLEPLTEPTGWALYCLKHHDYVCRAFGTNKIMFVSDELIRLAKAAH